MKTYRILWAILALVMTASPLMAQEQIEKLYQRMASDPKVRIKSSIQVDRKPGAGVVRKGSVCEINDFVIEKYNKKGRSVEHLEEYVTDLVNAIQAEASNPQCYRISSYYFGTSDAPRRWNLLYGEDASQYVTIGARRGVNYILACFVDKEYPDSRWCYAIEWYKVGKETIIGRYMKLYAKIPKETPATQEKGSHGFLASFNNLQAQWQSHEYKKNTALPVGFYALVKQAVEENMLTPDEKEFVDAQLTKMINKMSGDTLREDNALGYLILAKKILNRSQEP